MNNKKGLTAQWSTPFLLSANCSSVCYYDGPGCNCHDNYSQHQHNITPSGYLFPQALTFYRCLWCLCGWHNWGDHPIHEALSRLFLIRDILCTHVRFRLRAYGFGGVPAALASGELSGLLAPTPYVPAVSGLTNVLKVSLKVQSVFSSSTRGV